MDIILPIPPNNAHIHNDRNNIVCFSIEGVIQSKTRAIPNPKPPKKRRLLSKTGISGIVRASYIGLLTPNNRLIVARTNVRIAISAFTI